MWKVTLLNNRTGQKVSFIYGGSEPEARAKALQGKSPNEWRILHSRFVERSSR